MKISYQPAAPIEKERIRVQINAQVEEYLRRGGEISVLNNLGESGKSRVAGSRNDQDYFTLYPE
ncbi:MAG: hypothetical protein H6985_06605 [Pseudomonadales bacterium]|nr:hypothetical protein [Halioglobus sp.]MCP5129234.1 hypothetical protein [Pseudomonadales bacterium]